MIIIILTQLQWVASPTMPVVLTHYVNTVQYQIQQQQDVNVFQVLLTIYLPKAVESTISEIIAYKSDNMDLNWYVTNVMMDSFSPMITLLALLNVQQPTVPLVSMLTMITVRSVIKVSTQMILGSVAPVLLPTVKLVLKDFASNAKLDTNSSLMDLHAFLTFVRETWYLTVSHVLVLWEPTLQMIHAQNVPKTVNGAMPMGV